MEIENSCTMKTAFEICDNMQLLTLEKGNEVMAMSSIAYITNHEMIEYHRSHGSSEIVFWRFSGQRKFQNFNHGDYLFFLTKGTEKGKQKEKGAGGQIQGLRPGKRLFQSAQAGRRSRPAPQIPGLPPSGPFTPSATGFTALEPLL